MTWLMDNPIANMYGPRFLFFYGCVIAATLAWCWWRLRASDPTTDMRPIPLRSNPDPYEIAYLRGGENEMTRLAIFDLVQRGYLEIRESKKWWKTTEQQLRQAPNHPDPRHLSPMQRKVFEFFAKAPATAEIFESGAISSKLKGFCAEYDRKFEEEQMLCPTEVIEAARRIFVAGALIVCSLGLYKLIVALSKGRHNVMLLIVMGVFALIGLALVCRPPRQSHLGRDYLKRMQGVFERLKPKKGDLPSPALQDTTLLLLMSIFGVGVLTQTPYASFSQMFGKSASTGGCGGGCGGGSGCGGGGGCGGGCGGCGG